jgi:hypothetical protein
MDLVQKPRKPLDLVEQDPAPRANRPKLVREPDRIGEVCLVTALVEQVDPVRTRERLFDPGRLAGAAGAQQEKRALWTFESPSQHDKYPSI